MELKVKKQLIIDHIQLNNITTVTINENEVIFGRPYFYKIGKCNIQDIQKMIIDGHQIIKNGKILITCKVCETCPRCSEVKCSVYLNPNIYKQESCYYCDYKQVYAEEKNTLKKSNIKGKWEIELKKTYDVINNEFKYKREKYITEQSIKKCIDDIYYCMEPVNPQDAINEYGHKRIELEEIRINKNDYGYQVYHNGRIGDYGWTSKIYLHKKCNISKLYDALTYEFHINIKMEY